MNRRLSLIVVAALWTPGGHARVFQEMAKLAHSLHRFAKPIADCDVACLSASRSAGGTSVPNAVRIRGRQAADAFRSHLTREAHEIALSEPLKAIAVKKGNAAFVRYETQLQYILPMFETLDKFPEAVSKLARSTFAKDLAAKTPIDGATELGRSLMNQVGDQLIKSPLNENHFVALVVLARALDAGDGEFSAYARQLVAFRIALTESQRGLGSSSQLKTLYALLDTSDDGLLARLQAGVAAFKTSGSGEEIATSFTQLTPMNQALADFVRTVEKLQFKFADFGIDEVNVRTALATFGDVVEILSRAEGVVPDLELLQIVQRNYLGLGPWRETVRRIVYRNPDLADSPPFQELMKHDDFRLFVEHNLFR